MFYLKMCLYMLCGEGGRQRHKELEITDENDENKSREVGAGVGQFSDNVEIAEDWWIIIISFYD